MGSSSPNQVMLGRQVRLPQVLCPRTDPIPTGQYTKKLNDNLHSIYKHIKGVQTETTAFDPLIHSKYHVNDKVWVLNAKSKLNKPGKLEPRYSGLYVIKKVLDYDTYIISSPDGKERIEHHVRLKLANVEADDSHFNSENDMEIIESATVPDTSILENSSACNPVETEADHSSPELNTNTTSRKRLRKQPAHLKDYCLN